MDWLHTRIDSPASHQHRARAALTEVKTLLGTGEIERSQSAPSNVVHGAMSK
jgi:hypothetical protein